MTSTDTPRDDAADALRKALRKAEGAGWHPYALEAVRIAEQAIAALASRPAPSAEPVADVVEAVNNVLSGRCGIDHRDGFSVVSSARMREIAIKAAAQEAPWPMKTANKLHITGFEREGSRLIARLSNGDFIANVVEVQRDEIAIGRVLRTTLVLETHAGGCPESPHEEGKP